MAGKWRQLAPHFLAMFVIYLIGFQIIWMLADVRNFWVSLGIALAVAIAYPTLVRAVGLEPDIWSEETG